MSARWLWRGLGAALMVLAVVALARGIGLSWDPLGLRQRRVEALQQQARAGADEAKARSLEAEAQAAQSRALSERAAHAAHLAAETAAVIQQSRSAHDADLPIDPSRLARLREHDRILCDAIPDVCRRAAEAVDPSAGGDPMRPADAA